jgi:hypothetical protein
VHSGDPRADPTVVDLIELAGLWLAAGDWEAFSRTLRRLDEELSGRFPHDQEFLARFQTLVSLVERATSNDALAADELRRAYRRATVG